MTMQDINDDDEDYADFDCIEWEEQNNKVNHESLNIELEPKSQQKSTRIKRKAVRFEEEDYSAAFERYKICLANSLNNFSSFIAVCNEVCLIECLKSTIPSLFSSELRPMPHSINFIRSLCQQFSNTFTKLDDDDFSDEEVGDCANPDCLISTTIPRSGGSSLQLNQIFTALVHSLHYKVRLVAPFDPSESFLPVEHEDLRRKRWESSGNEEHYKKAKEKKKLSSVFWTEIYLPIDAISECVECCDLTGEATSSVVTSIQRDIWGWVHVDAVNNVINSTSFVEGSLRKGRAVHFVLAAEPSGEITDVTSQYSTIHTHNSNVWKSRKLLADSYLCELIRQENRKQSASTSSIYTKKRRLEESESNRSSNSASSDLPTALPPLPTRFIDFKDHPIYFLERYLLASEALHPFQKKSVSLFRGENVYLQSHRQLLKSKWQWRREMRAVRDGEEPYKVSQRKIMNESDSSSSSSSSNNHTDMKEIPLYGVWQTTVLEVLHCQNSFSFFSCLRHFETKNFTC